MTCPEDYSPDLSDSEDILSFANLPIPGYKYDDVSGRVSSSTDQDCFEFQNSSGCDPIKNDAVLFWGCRSKLGNQSVKEARPSFESASYRKFYGYQRKSCSGWKTRSSSVRLENSDSLRSHRFLSDQNASYAGITLVPAKSGQPMSALGAAKFNPEIDVNEIKKRQNCRDQPQAVTAEVDSVDEGASGGKPVKPSSNRSHIVNILAKSFSCLST